jgi:hypothetical protein
MPTLGAEVGFFNGASGVTFTVGENSRALWTFHDACNGRGASAVVRTSGHATA